MTNDSSKLEKQVEILQRANRFLSEQLASAHETGADDVLCRIHRELARGHSSVALQVVAAAIEQQPLPSCVACDVIAAMPVINASSEKASASLLHPPSTQAPPGCHCRDRCMAPVVMGRQTPCRDPEKAATFAQNGSPQS